MLFECEFSPLIERFAAVLARASPVLDAEALAWRLQSAVGAMVHSMTCQEPAVWLGGSAPRTREAVEAMLGEPVRFSVAGLCRSARERRA